MSAVLESSTFCALCAWDIRISAGCNDLDLSWRFLLSSVGLVGLIDKTLQHVNGVLSAVELVESFHRFG